MLGEVGRISRTRASRLGAHRLGGCVDPLVCPESAGKMSLGAATISRPLRAKPPIGPT